MDIGTQSAQTTTDDAELAKVLEGMNHTNDTNSGLSFEETPVGGSNVNAPVTDAPVQDAASEPAVTAEPSADQQVPDSPVVDTPPEAPIAEPTYDTQPQEEPANQTPNENATPSPLDDIKKDAIDQLRPLIGKLDLPAEEKFDTILLLIRSTDDQSLVSAAYDAAKAIPDEGKRASALLDIIKEIDFFSQSHA